MIERCGPGAPRQDAPRPMRLSAKRQIIGGYVARDAGPVGQRDFAPQLAAIGEAILADERCSVGQSNDDPVLKARTFTKLQKIVRPDPLDHGTRTHGTSGDQHDCNKSRKKRSHDLTHIVLPSLRHRGAK